MPGRRRKLVHEIDCQVAGRWIRYNNFHFRGDSNRKRTMPFAFHSQGGSAWQAKPVDQDGEEKHNIPDYERVEVCWVPKCWNQPGKSGACQQKKPRPDSGTETAVSLCDTFHGGRRQWSRYTHFGTSTAARTSVSTRSVSKPSSS